MHGELLAAVARGAVRALPELSLQGLPHHAQQLVAHRVPEAVVDVLEVVEVEHEQGERLIVAPGPRDLVAQALPEVPVVVEPGEAVDDRLPLDGLLLLLQAVVQLGVVDGDARLLAERHAERGLLLGEVARVHHLAHLERSDHLAAHHQRDHERRHLAPLEQLPAHHVVQRRVVEAHLDRTARAYHGEVLRQVLDRVHRAERLLEVVRGVALVLGQPDHGVGLRVVLVDVARPGVQGQRRLPADDLEELVQVERRGHRPRGADHGRELPVALFGRARGARVGERDGGQRGHLADQTHVSVGEGPVTLLLGELQHAEHPVAVHDRRPDRRPLAPELHGLEPRGGCVDLVVGIRAQHLATLDHAPEPGGAREPVRLADPLDVVLAGDARPEGLGTEDVARGIVLVDAAFGALERLGDLLGELHEGVAEQGVLAGAPVVHQGERRARALVVVHDPHHLAGEEVSVARRTA